MCFGANYWISKRGPVSQFRSFALLGATLAIGLLVTRLSMAGIVLPAAKLFMPILLTLPLFFAGLIFSSHLAKGEGLGNALSANLFGAMLGGFLEYNSMYLGLSSLYLFGGGSMRVRLFACGSIARKMHAPLPETAATPVKVAA